MKSEKAIEMMEIEINSRKQALLRYQAMSELPMAHAEAKKAYKHYVAKEKEEIESLSIVLAAAKLFYDNAAFTTYEGKDGIFVGVNLVLISEVADLHEIGIDVIEREDDDEDHH